MAQSILDLILRTKKEGNAEAQTESGVKGLLGKFESLTGVSLGATAAVGALAAGLAFSVKSAAEAEQIQAQLGAVLKSTGGAAGLSADEVNKMASEMSRLTGIEDDSIVKANSVLLTFTKIGKEVFPDASMAALNMSSALGTDLQGSIIQIGKALNDPIKGVTALQRVGVSFTKSQRDQIKALVDSGRAMDAQRLILAELETEFGGAAEAAGSTAVGAWNKFKNALGNVAEEIGGSLLPALTDGLNAITDWITASEVAAENLERDRDLAADTATSYEDYTVQVQAALEAAGLYSKVKEDGIHVYEREGQVVRDVTDKVGLMTKAQFEANQAVLVIGDTRRESIDLLQAETTATEDLTEADDLLKQELNALKELIAGPVGEEYDKFMERNIDLKDRAEELRSKILELEGRQYLTSAQKEELTTTKEELGEVTSAILENEQQHTASTLQILFNMAEQRLAIDGFTEDELTLLENLAVRWGLIDEKTGAAAEGMKTALGDFAKSGDVASALDALDDVAEAAGAIPRNITIRIRTEVRGLGRNVDPIGGNIPENQMGGPVFAQEPVIWNEPGNPEMLLSAQNGFIMNLRQAQEALTGAVAGLRGAGSRGGTVVIHNLNLPDVRDAVSFLEEIQRLQV